MQALSDEALVMRVVNRPGDQRPFEELYRRHQAMVWRVCQRFMGSPSDAEEVMQETFFKAYRNLKKFRGNASFSTWLYRIAINTSQNALKKRMRQLQLEPKPIDEFIDLASEHASPEQQLLALERRNQLALALEQLKLSELEALRLREFEGLGYNQIAQHWGVKLSTAKMRVIRARIALQEAYRRIDAEGGK